MIWLAPANIYILCLQRDEVPYDLTCSGNNMLCFECNEVPYNLTCPSNNMLCFELTEVPFDSVANDVALLRDCLSLYPERKYINIISGIATPGDVSLNALFLV